MLVLLLLATRALASQVVITELTYTHSGTTTFDSHKKALPLPGSPLNWRSPIDYASGTAVVRLEVFTKPTATPTKFQICFEGTPNYACTDQLMAYTTTGIYTWTTAFPNFYQFALVDWTKGTNMIAMILKDTNNVKPSPENVGAAVSALYMPTDLRVTVTLVSPGGTYVPPPATVTDGGTADAGRPDSGMVVDAGRPDAGKVVDAGPGGPDAGTEIDSGVRVEDAGLTVDAGEVVADAGPGLPDGGRITKPGVDPQPGAGCSCDASGGGLWLLSTALLLRRRKG